MTASEDNVFRGPQSVADYFDPDKNPMLPLVEIPDRLNPLRQDHVRIYAKMLTCLPAHNVKSLPALQMLRQEPRAQHSTIAEASSGSTILSLGILAKVLWGHEDVEAHVTNKKSPESLNLLRFFGIKPSLFPGLAQQEPTDPTGIMERLRRKASENDNMVYLGQYDNNNNWKAHALWTGPQILKQLPEVSIFSTTVGTGGCITGTGVALKAQKPSIKVLGVFNVAGDPVPGPRYYEGFQSSPFPWQETIDDRVEVDSISAYRMSMKLSREGLISGPSSGEALQGLLQYLTELNRTDRLKELADETNGEISCVFTCSDLPYQYLPGYFDKLGVAEFPSIEKQILLKCDQSKHDLRWILDADQAAEMARENMFQKQETSTMVEVCSSTESLDSTIDTGSRTSRDFWRLCGLIRPFQKRKRVRLHAVERDSPSALVRNSTVVVVDIRQKADYDLHHFPESLAFPLSGLDTEKGEGDLFGDADAVFATCNSLQQWVQGADLSLLMAHASKDHRKVIVVCYDGFASQLACSAIREKGVEAFSVRGGYAMLSGHSRIGLAKSA